MKWHFLRVVDDRTNVANSHENLLVCSVYTPSREETLPMIKNSIPYIRKEGYGRKMFGITPWKEK